MDRYLCVVLPLRCGRDFGASSVVDGAAASFSALLVAILSKVVHGYEARKALQVMSQQTAFRSSSTR